MKIFFLLAFPRPTTCDRRRKNCNIFTIVGRGETLNVKREAERFIEVLTGRILTAFSAVVPKWTGARMGTAFRSYQTWLLPGLALQNFLPTSEIFLSFLPLPTACCLLPTAFFLSPLFWPQSLSPRGHSLSPQAPFALSWRRIAPIFQKRLEA